MAEYIKRMRAMTVCERYSQHCFEQNDSHGQDIADRIFDDIVEIPTADVVPVVRCENCKYFEIDEEDELGECKCGYLSLSYSGALYPRRTDYCNYGERKSQKWI